MRKGQGITLVVAFCALLTSLGIVGAAFVGLKAAETLANCGRPSGSDCRNNPAGPPPGNPGMPAAFATPRPQNVPNSAAAGNTGLPPGQLNRGSGANPGG